MTKTEYLNILYNGLSDLPNEEREEILYKYKELFESNLSQGKTEQEIINELGDPYTIINNYRLNQQSATINYKNSSNNSGLLKIIIISLVIFAFIFLSPAILGIIIVPFGIVISLFGIALAFGVSGIALALGKTLSVSVPYLSIPASLMSLPSSSMILLALGTLALGVLAFVGIFYLIKFLIIALKKLVYWIKTL